MRFKCAAILLPLLLAAASSSAQANAKVAKPVKAKTAKQTVKQKRINRDQFKPNQFRRATHIKEQLKPTINIVTWGIQKTVTQQTTNVRRDPYTVTSNGAPRGTKVTAQAQEKSANIKYTGKPTQKTVAEALRWGAAFEVHTIETSSSKQDNVVNRPQELDTHTPYKATFKDPYNRTAVRTRNAQGKTTKEISRTTKWVNPRNVETVVTHSGAFLNAYQTWANLDNVRITPASRAFSKSDYTQLAKNYEQAASRLERQAGKRPTSEQTSDLRYLRSASKSASQKVKRLIRIEKMIGHIEVQLKSEKLSEAARKQFKEKSAELQKQLPSTKSTSRFVALAAFPANSTITLTNLRMAGEGGNAAKAATITLKANGTGSVAGEIPGWQRDKIEMSVSYPAQTNKSRGTSTTSYFNLPKNSDGSGYKIRGVEFKKITEPAPVSAEVKAPVDTGAKG